MTRISRSESRERTRELLLDSARTLFLNDGFNETSLNQVASEAGFTIGAIYSNFSSKAELGVAVIDRIYQFEGERAAAAVTAAASGPMAWVDALVAWAYDGIGDRRLARLEIAVAAAATEPTFSSAAAERYARVRARMAQAIREASQAVASPTPSETEDIALGIVTFALGLGVQRAADPQLPIEKFGRLLKLALGSVGDIPGARTAAVERK